MLGDRYIGLSERLSQLHNNLTFCSEAVARCIHNEANRNKINRWTDPFKIAMYSILGRCNPNPRDYDNSFIFFSIDDYS